MELSKDAKESTEMHLARMKEVLDSAKMGIWRTTMCEGCEPRMSASDKMLELIGLEKDCKCTEEEVYDAWFSRICPESAKAVDKYVHNMVEKGSDEVTYLWSHPKKGKRYVRCGGVGYKLDDGTVVLEGYHYDVTEQLTKQMQDTLVINSLANLYASVFYIDMENDSYISYVNKLPNVFDVIPLTGSFSKSFALFPDNFCHESEKERLREFTDLSTLNKRLQYRNSICVQYRGRHIGWLRFTLLVSDRNADGTVRHMVATVEDITEIRNKEMERLEELKMNIDANHSKTMMLQNMTHEIRTPLNAMFGFSQLLCMPDGCITDEQKAEYFNYIYNSFNMLSMLIDDVLDITDAEHGNYRITKSRFAVNTVCRNAMQMAEIRLYDGVKMYFTTDVADDYTIESDDRRIQQLLVNILTNACKHTQQGEIHMDLSTKENPGHLTFSVTDTGEGIPEDMRKDIFERYKKANDSVQGSGLGLHICSTIAEKLGAQIKLDESYTTGARFLFIL